MIRTIVFRADSSPEIGMGHVYRLISIIKYLHKDYRCLLVTNNISALPTKDLSSLFFEVIEINQQFKYCTPDKKNKEEEIDFDLGFLLKGDEIVVIDGYWLGERYRHSVKLTGAKLVVIDDFAEGFFYADMIINHAPCVDKSSYNALPNTKFLLGTDFSIIRPAFLNLARVVTDVKKRSKSILICFGGTDYFDFTSLMLEVVVSTGIFEEINVVVGKGYSYTNQLVKKYGERIVIHRDLEEVKLSELMAICESAIVPSSTVLYEALAAGCNVVTGYYTQNQKMIYDGFVSKELVVGCNDFKGISKDFFIDFNKKKITNPNIIDGFSDIRIKHAFEQI
jgi:UDP-2,4-diacetamido-2,4,6-trideoxy-beta-L-altropyranose hydrolase